MTDTPTIYWDETVYPRGPWDDEDGPVMVSQLSCDRLLDAGYTAEVVEQRIGLGGCVLTYFHRKKRQKEPKVSWVITNKRWYQTFDDAYAAANKWAKRRLGGKARWCRSRGVVGKECIGQPSRTFTGLREVP